MQTMSTRSKITRKIRLAMSLVLIASTFVWTLVLIRPPIQVYAANFIVNSTSDASDANNEDGICETATGTCTLRAAIEQANSLDGTHTITLPAGTYKLDNGVIEISKGMTIQGAGTASTTIDAQEKSRIFFINGTLSNKVTISGMKLTQGYTSAGSGGAIRSIESTLDISNVAITSSRAEYGGGLINAYGTATLTMVTLSSNHADIEGGAIHNYGVSGKSATMTLNTVTVQNNEAGMNGGGVYNDAHTQLTIQQNSAIVGNKVINHDGSGGGLFTYGKATIQDSRVVSNQANETGCTACYGGGISVDVKEGTGSLTLTRSVVEYNTAYHHGGGIYNKGTTTITDSKIGYNETTYISGGGIYNDSKTGPGNYGLTIKTTDIYSNTAKVKPDNTNYSHEGKTYSIIGSTGNRDYRANGGGFANGLTGSALVEDSTFRFNRAYSEGGAVMNRGAARFTNVSFTENHVLGYYVLFNWYNGKPKWNAEGGAILNESPANSIVSNCEFLRNTSTNGGGAIANKFNLDVVDSLFADNKVLEPTGEEPNAAVSASGGAIDNYYGNDESRLLLRRSVIRNNWADKVGGGISSMSAGIKIYDTAIISNTAKNAGGGILFNVRYAGDPCTKAELYNVTISGNNVTDGSGGAIYNERGYESNPDGKCSNQPRYVKLTNTTIVYNTASAASDENIGGIQNEHVDSHGDKKNNWVKNSIIAHNTRGATPSNCGGSQKMYSQDYNVSNNSCDWLDQSNDKKDTDPKVDKLADNGGSTYTHALQPGSPAYDSIPDSKRTQDTDQRGYSRVGTNSDVGAFEAQPPTARNDTASVEVGSGTKNIPVLVNDTSDPAGYLDVSTVTLVDNPETRATVKGDGTIEYNRSGLSEGNYTFTYWVKDQRNPPAALQSNTATVTVTVSSNAHPTVSDVTKTTEEDTTVLFVKEDFQDKYSDPDSDPDSISMVKVKIVSLPAHGTLTLAGTAVSAGQEIQAAELGGLGFTPEAHWNNDSTSFDWNAASFDWNAADEFNYADNGAHVNITVSSVNDAPTLDDILKSVDEDKSLTMTQADFTAAYNDPDGTLATVQITSLPEHGVLTKGSTNVAINNTINVDEIGTLVFKPDLHWHGVTSFGWNGKGSVDGDTYAAHSKLVIMTVNSVEDPPTLKDFSKTGLENDTILFADTDFTNNFSDVDTGDSLKKVKITSLPDTTHGTLKVGTANVTLNQEIDGADIGKLSFVPTAGWSGDTSFSWNASDGNVYAGSSATGSIKITKVPQAATPTVYDLTKRTDEDTRMAFAASDFTAKFSDPAGSLAKIKVTTSSLSGTLALKNGDVYVPVGNNQEINAADLGNLTYIPDANWNGTTQCTWTGTSGTTYQAIPATVTVIVNAVSDPPVAVGDVNSTKVTAALSVLPSDGVLNNDTDPEGSDLIVASYETTSTLQAAVKVRSTGSYFYDPTVSLSITEELKTQPFVVDSFKYVVVDTDGLTSTGTVSITVYRQDTDKAIIDATATAVVQAATAVVQQQTAASLATATTVVENATATVAQQTAVVAQQTATVAQQQTATVAQQTATVAQQTATVAQQTATVAAQQTAVVAQQTATVAQQTATAVVAQQTATVAAQQTATVVQTPTLTVTTSPTATVSASPTMTTTPTVSASPTMTTTPTVTVSPTMTTTVIPGVQPTLRVNYFTGKPGSTFIFTATNFPAGSQGIIRINEKELGTITIGSDGSVQFIIVTTGASVGSYTISVTVNDGASLVARYEAATTLQLVEDADMREASPDTVAPKFKTGDISQNGIQVYLPMVQRPQ